MQYTKYLKWACLGLISIIFLVPFIIANGALFPEAFFPYITGKNFAFRLLVEALLAVYVLLALYDTRYRPQRSPLLWALGGFIVWMGLATILSVDPVKSFWSNFERMEGYVGLVHLGIYAVVTSSVLSAAGWWNGAMRIAVASSVIQAVIAVFQILNIFGFAPSSQSGPRADGTIGNAAYLAVFMLFGFFITLYLLVRERRSMTAQVVYGIALVLQASALYFTQTRGTLLGFIGGLMIMAIWILIRTGRGQEWKTLRRISIGGLVAVCLMVGAFLALRNTSFVQSHETLQRFAAISLTDRTTISRFMVWHMALQGFADKPVFGWGQENFSYVFNQYYNPRMYNQEQWFDRAHNAFLDWLIAGGLPAFLLYLSLFVLAAVAIMRSELEVPAQAALLGLLAGYGFNNLLVFDNLISYLYFFFIIAFAHSLRASHASSREHKRGISDHGLAIAVPAVVVVTALCMWVVNAPGIARANALLTAILPYSIDANGQQQQKDPGNALADFKRAFSVSTWPGGGPGQQEVAEQVLQIASDPSISADPTVGVQYQEVATTFMTHMLAQRKDDARLELFMGTFLDALGKPQEAAAYLDQALLHSPKKQSILFESGISAINRQESERGVAYLKTAFDLAPEYDTARLIYASGLYYVTQKEEADRILNERYGTVLVDDQRLIQVYVNTKQFDRVVGIWQKRVEAAPEDPEQHIGLASAYFAAGDKAHAIESLKKASEINPALSAQVNTIIEQINNGTLKPQ